MTELKSKHFFDAKLLAKNLYQIANRSYQHGSPWSEEQFLEDIRNKQSEYLLLQETEILGFLGYHQFLDEMEIFNLVIDRSQKKKGYGSQLLKELVKLAQEEQIAQILLEVRVSNLSAQNLYLSNGFEVVARRKDYYQQPIEDALIMIKKVRPTQVK